jgi:hypothetical protein
MTTLRIPKGGFAQRLRSAERRHKTIYPALARLREIGKKRTCSGSGPARTTAAQPETTATILLAASRRPAPATFRGAD